MEQLAIMAAGPDAQKTMHLLKENLLDWAYAYYAQDDPKVTDDVYDTSLRALAELEQAYPQYVEADSPVGKVMGGLSPSLPAVPIQVPMLSLVTQTTPPAQNPWLISWLEMIYKTANGRDPMLRVETKYDGLALNLVISNGQIVGMNTRGEHGTGESVMHALPIMRFRQDSADSFDSEQFQSFLQSQVRSSTPYELRGEVIVTSPVFGYINEVLKGEGRKPYATPRHAASGLVRSLKLPECLKGLTPLLFMIYGWGIEPEGEPKDIADVFAIPIEEQFTPELAGRLKYDWGTAQGAKHWIAYITGIFEDIHFNLPMPNDGLVFKVGNKAIQMELGSTELGPRWAYAQKFEPEVSYTKVTKITLQVGRTGKITPVAILQPVLIGGVMVSRCTLHNEDRCKKLGIYEGATVCVRRDGDVIPGIAHVLDPHEDGFDMEAVLNGKCPACGGVTYRAPGEADYRCQGGCQCPAQQEALLEHYCSKQAMDIRGFGPETIKSLLEIGMVKSYADLYELSEEGLMLGLGCTAATAKKLAEAVQASRHTTLARFIYALGIPEVGMATAKDLAQQFKRFHILFGVDLDDLTQTPGVGTKTAVNFKLHVDNPQNRQQLFKVAELLHFEVIPEGSLPLQGWTAVITGTLRGYTREQARAEIERRGGRVVGSVGASVPERSVLIFGAGYTQSKFQAAHNANWNMTNAFQQFLDNPTLR